MIDYPSVTAYAVPAPLTRGAKGSCKRVSVLPELHRGRDGKSCHGAAAYAPQLIFGKYTFMTLTFQERWSGRRGSNPLVSRYGAEQKNERSKCPL